MNEMIDKNIKVFEDYIQGEEGIDYVQRPKDYMDPEMPSEKILEKQIRQEIKMIKL